MSEYSDYWDWYDNGPGSEKWKVELYRRFKKSDFTELNIKGFPWYKEEKKQVIELPEELFKV